jgi:hypothetical protein
MGISENIGSLLYKLLANMRGFSIHSKHVKISRAGKNVLQNRQLTRKIVDAILEKKTELDNGGSVTVESNGQEVSVSLSGGTEAKNEAK